MKEPGGPEVLRVEDRPDAEPGPGELLVRVRAAGISYGDVIVRSGRFAVPLPAVIGFEVAGEVTAAGDDVDPAWLGRTVAGTTVGNNGGYAELARVAVGHACEIPAGLTPASAVACFQAAPLAEGMLDALPVTAADTVLITAAAGRIGRYLAGGAQRRGARVIGGVGSSAKERAALEAGAGQVVVYSDDGWPDRVRELTGGRGVDAAFDAVGGELGTQVIDLLAAGGGRLGIFGFGSGEWAALHTRTIAARGLTVVGVVGKVTSTPDDVQHAAAERALAAAAAGEVRSLVGASFPLERAADAHAHVESRAAVGATVLTVR
jgi:NADPH:quinone reductase